MPNNKPKCKTRIDAHAKRALKEIGKMTKALKLDLTKVKKDLQAIMADHHHL
jgi:hypothetical protein